MLQTYSVLTSHSLSVSPLISSVIYSYSKDQSVTPAAKAASFSRYILYSLANLLLRLHNLDNQLLYMHIYHILILLEIAISCGKISCYYYMRMQLYNQHFLSLFPHLHSHAQTLRPSVRPSAPSHQQVGHHALPSFSDFFLLRMSVFPATWSRLCQG